MKWVVPKSGFDEEGIYRVNAAEQLHTAVRT